MKTGQVTSPGGGTPPAATSTETSRLPGSRPGYGTGVRSRTALYPSSEDPKTVKIDQPTQKPAETKTELTETEKSKENINQPEKPKELPKLAIKVEPTESTEDMIILKGLTRLSSPRLVNKPRPPTVTRQRSRADNIVGVNSSISTALARAGTTLHEITESQEPNNTTKAEQPEQTSLRERISTLEMINADAMKTIESLSQQKATLEQNTERIKADLRNQYKENAQLQLLVKERDELKEKLEKFKIDSSTTTSTLTIQLSTLQEESTQLRRDLKTTKETTTRLEAERDELKERTKLIDDLRTVRDLLQAEKADLEAALQKEQKDSKEGRGAKERAVTLEEKCKALETEVRNLKQSRTQAEPQAVQKVAALTTELLHAKSQVEQLEKELKKSKDENRSSEAKITRLQSENAQISDSLAKAHQNLSSANEVSNEAMNSIAKLEHDLDAVKVQRDKYSFDLQQTQSNLKLVTSESERLTTQLHKELTRVTEERNQLETSLRTSAEANKENETNINQLKIEIKLVKEEREHMRSNLSASEDNAAEAQFELETLREKYSSLEEELQHAKSKSNKEEGLLVTIAKLEKELFDRCTERDELKQDNDTMNLTIMELSTSKNENLKEEIQKIENSYEQKITQLEQRNAKLTTLVEQKTDVAEAAETIIANLKDSLAQAQHQNEFLINERDYLQKETDRLKKEMTRSLENLDRRASVEVNSLSEQLEAVTAERNLLVSRNEVLASQVREALDSNKTLTHTVMVVESEVASLKEVNADLHTNLEKLEEQREELSQQLHTTREQHQQNTKKLAQDIEKEKLAKIKSDEAAIKLNAELASLTTTIKSLKEACAEYEAKIVKLKQEINNIREERDELQAAFGNQDEAVGSIAKQRDKLIDEVSRLTTELTQYENMKEEYQRSKNHIQRQDMELQDLAREQEHLQRRLDRITRENSELTAEVASLKVQSDRLHTVEHDLRTMRNEKSNLERDLDQLIAVRDDLNRLMRENAGLAKENEQLLRQNEEKAKKLTEFDMINAEYEQLKSTNLLQEGDIIKLDDDLTALKDVVKIQEEDLDKFEAEIHRLHEELDELTTKNNELEQALSVCVPEGGEQGKSISAILKQKDVELRILREKNTSLEKAAGTLAMQVTHLCDTVEKCRDIESAFGKLDSENDRLANEIKVLEAELNARETEIQNVLSDNQQLVLKLNSMGYKVKMTEKGINFVKGEE